MGQWGCLRVWGSVGELRERERERENMNVYVFVYLTVCVCVCACTQLCLCVCVWLCVYLCMMSKLYLHISVFPLICGEWKTRQSFIIIVVNAFRRRSKELWSNSSWCFNCKHRQTFATACIDLQPWLSNSELMQPSSSYMCWIYSGISMYSNSCIFSVLCWWACSLYLSSHWQFCHNSIRESIKSSSVSDISVRILP